MKKPAGSRCAKLHLQTLYNTRDLGGMAAAGGRQTLFGRFVRSDAPVRLNESDLSALIAYPVRTVIDLRSQNEISRQPNSLRGHEQICYHNIPLLGQDLEQDMINLQKKNGHKGIELVDLYLHILDQSGQAIGTVLRTMARTGEGAVLFHCTHGKDRTGIIAALLLLLAGVAPRHITEDYRISEAQLKPWFDTFIQAVPEADRRFFITPARYMKKTLQHLAGQHGSVQAYLHSCGVDDDTQEQLRSRLLDP